MSIHEFTVTADTDGMRLDILLAKEANVLSRAQAVRLIEAGAVYVNSYLSTTKRRQLQTGDIVRYQLTAAPPPGLLPQFMPLDIRYEDEHLIVLSKPSGLVCHPAAGHQTGTLVNALIAYCGYENLAQIQGEDRPGIVHRLDKDTSGLMVVAKTDLAGQRLSDAIKLRELKRHYLTLVHGFVAGDSGLIDAPLARGVKDRTRFMVSNEPGARTAVTSFMVLERYEAGRDDDGFCLLECRLFTGRTHQIRVHMAYTQHPCVGDALYGKASGKSRRRNIDELGLTRQFLHSCSLSLIHPISQQLLEFVDPLPTDLQAAIDQLKTRSLGLTEEGKSLLPLFVGNVL
ncbi:MAG: RluA family pseudouridine synthase [Coriobacteriales bacterium]|jgi:23S rRNA pseudouridine1911/1915/1917 synthase|nr:RluA family pseudouridine synthase [Coriobacteriales bacterium]